MKSESLSIRSRLGDYPVNFHESLDFIAEVLAKPNPVVVVDAKLFNLYKTLFHLALDGHPVYLLDAVEDKKTLDEASRIYCWILDTFSAKRNIDFISFGGGITQDISGFVASTLFRGVNWEFVPTTLLAQVDSCVGGKTSLNFGNRKNLLGTFYPPRAIHIAPAFTQTLSELDLFSGYGEIAKFLLMQAFESGRPLATVAGEMGAITHHQAELAPLVRECLNIKRSFMEADEFDRGRRNLLNYGHCFGHALEAASEYYVPHGVAVNIGIIFANLAAAARKMIPQSDVDQITREVNLPLIIQKQRLSDYDPERLLQSMKNDKKRTGKALPLVVPAGGGLVKLDDFTELEFRSTWTLLTELLFK